MSRIAAALVYAVLGLVTFFVCFPLLWAISTSLKPCARSFSACSRM